MNGKTFLIYTTQMGGFFKSLVDADGRIIKFSQEEYDSLKESRELDITPAYQDGPREIVEPVLIMLARIEDNYDFVLERSRDVISA